MPKAIAPKAPWVLVWESPQTMVMPGRVSPSSGPITWTMPRCSDSQSSSAMPWARQLRRKASTCCSASVVTQARCPSGAAASVDKVVPAISPIFGQNPAFQLFTYDRENGRLRDFSTVALMNLPALGPGPGDWRETYVFTKAYDLPGFSAESVARLWNGLGQGGTRRTAYLANYNAGHGNLAQADLDAYACAIAALGRSGYAACLCGE